MLVKRLETETNHNMLVQFEISGMKIRVKGIDQNR